MKKVVFNTPPNVLFAIPADMFVAATLPHALVLNGSERMAYLLTMVYWCSFRKYLRN